MGARILVAEDNAEISSFLSDFLALKGHEVTVVDNGPHLLLQAAALLPDLIITDVQMPGGAGSVAYDSLRRDEKTRGIPIIFISAHPAGSFLRDAPSTRYVQKPFDHEELSGFVAELLSSREGSAEEAK